MKSLVKSVRRFHESEDGMEALQTVVILAVASLVLVGLYKVWDTKIKPTMEKEVIEVMTKGT